MEGRHGISGVLGVIATQCLELGEEPQYLLSPDAFYYHARWLYEHGKLTAEDLQHTVQWLDAYDHVPPADDEL